MAGEIENKAISSLNLVESEDELGNYGINKIRCHRLKPSVYHESRNCKRKSVKSFAGHLRVTFSSTLPWFIGLSCIGFALSLLTM